MSPFGSVCLKTGKTQQSIFLRIRSATAVVCLKVTLERRGRKRLKLCSSPNSYLGDNSFYLVFFFSLRLFVCLFVFSNPFSLPFSIIKWWAISSITQVESEKWGLEHKNQTVNALFCILVFWTFTECKIPLPSFRLNYLRISAFLCKKEKKKEKKREAMTVFLLNATSDNDPFLPLTCSLTMETVLLCIRLLHYCQSFLRQRNK